MRSSLSLLVLVGVLMGVALAQPVIPFTYKVSGPRFTSIAYAGDWNEIYIELPNGPETSELTFEINLMDGAIPTTYFALRPTSTPDPATATHFEFTIDAGQDHITIFTYTYRARDDSSYPSNPYDSSNNYQLTGPITATVLDLAVQLRAWSYRLIPGKASVSVSGGVASVSGRVGDDLTLEVNLIDTNHTLPGGNQPISLLFISPDQFEYNVLNAITPTEPTIGALVEHENFTLTLADFGEIPGTTGYGMYLVQPTWIYDTVAPLIQITITGGNDIINGVTETVDGAPTGSSDIARYVGDTFDIRLTLGDDDGEVPISGAVISIAPSDPTTGWNMVLTGGATQFTIPQSAFDRFGNGTFVFSGSIILPIAGPVYYDIIWESPSGFSSLPQAFSVRSLQKQTQSTYPSSKVPAAIVELKVTGSNGGSTGQPLPGDSFTVTLHTNDVAPFASTDIVWNLFVVPLDNSQNDPNAYTITSGQATQSAGSNNVLSPPFAGTFNDAGTYRLCLVPSTNEYSSICTDVDVSVGCTVSDSYIQLNVDPTVGPDSFSVTYDAFDASQLPITVSLNANDVAALSPYMTFLNSSITYQPGVPTGSNLFYFQHLAFPPTTGSSCVRVESSFNPLGLPSGALCGSVCFYWPTYSASLSNTDYNFQETYPHVGDTITLIVSHTATDPGMPSVTYDVFVSNSAWSLKTTTPLTLSPTVPSLPVVFEFNGWSGVDANCLNDQTAVSLLVPAAFPYIASNTIDDSSLLGQFDPRPLTVLLGNLAGAVRTASCGAIPAIPYQYLIAGESAPVWVRLDTDSEVFMTSGSAYTISITPLQTDRTVNIGTWDRTSFAVNQGDDWQLQNFTFTATTPGTASFLISSSPADFAPFILKLRVVPQYDTWRMTATSSTSSNLGIMDDFYLQFSSSLIREGITSLSYSGLSRYDNDKRIRVEVYGSANVSLVYPVPDADGWITVKRGTYRQPIVWTCNTIGTGYFHFVPADAYPVYVDQQVIVAYGCYDSTVRFIPSSLPLIERGQSVELTFAVYDQSPKTGRNESLTVSLVTGANANIISLGEVHLSERQLVLNQNEYFKTFTAKAVNEGVVSVGGYLTTGTDSTQMSFQIGRSAADRQWSLQSSTDTIGINTYFYVRLCPPRYYNSALFPAVEPIELPIPFNIVFSGEAALGATVVTADFEDGIPNPQYWTEWQSQCFNYYMIASRAGSLEVSVEFLNTTIGTGKKAVTYQQTNPFPCSVLVQEPTQMVTSDGSTFSQEITLANVGDFIEYFVWHPNPETTESDDGFTLQPILTQSRYGGSVSVSAVNVRTGTTIGDLFATGIRITPTDNQFVVKVEQMSPGLVVLMWQTSTRGYEPISDSSSQFQRYQLTAPNTVGSADVPALITMSSNFNSFTVWPGSVFTVTFSLSYFAPADTQITVSTVAPSADLLTFNPPTFTIPAGSLSAAVEVTATGYGQAYIRAQPSSTTYVAPLAQSITIGDVLYIDNWQRYMREDRVFTFSVSRTDYVAVNFFQDLQVQLLAAESPVQKGSLDNVEWGFALLDDSYQPIANNIVTIPAGKESIDVRAVVNASTNAVTIVRVTAVAGAASGYTDAYVNLEDSYPLVSKKVLTLLGDPLIGKNGTAQMVFFHCPSEATYNDEQFTIYPHGAMLVYPTTFYCDSSDPVARVWIWGEANRMDIVSEYQRAAYDPREDLSDMAILELSPIGNNGKAETL